MMTMQARESLFPIKHPDHPLRTYPADSPRAKARLVVLALLADGRVDAAELDGLAKYQAFDELGISRDDFFRCSTISVPMPPGCLRAAAIT